MWKRLPNLRWSNLELQQSSFRMIPHVTVCKVTKIGDRVLHKGSWFSLALSWVELNCV